MTINNRYRRVMVFLLTAGLVAGLIFSFAFIASGKNDLESRIQGAIAKLKTGSPAEQDIAEQQLKKIGTPALPQLIEVFKEDKALISSIPSVYTPDYLSSAVTPPARVLRIIVSLGPQIAPNLVQIAGQAEAEDVCLAALKVLYFITIPKTPNVVTELIPELIKVCQNSKWVNVRSNVLIFLLTMRDKRIVPIICESLLNSDKYYTDDGFGENIMTAAFGFLGEIGDVQAVPALINLLKRPMTPEMQARAINSKIEAIRTLGRMGDKRATGILVEFLLKDDNRSVRGASAGALVQLHDPQILGTIKEALADTNKDLSDRTDLAWVVASLGNSSGLPIIDEALKVGDRTTKGVALAALAYLDNKENIPRAVEALRDEDPVVQLGAAYLLLLKGNDAGTPIIFAHLHDQDFQLRSMAVMCLEAMDDIRAKPILLELVKDEDMRIRVMAMELLVEKVNYSSLSSMDRWTLSAEDLEVCAIAYFMKERREVKLKALK